MVISNPKSREIGRYVNDYPSAAKFLGSKGSRKLANNTKVYRVMLGGYYGLQDEIHVRLHNTDIVSYRADGVITLNSGGYQTVTTKQRINQLLPPGFDIRQIKHNWWLYAPDGSREEFFDGIKIQYHTSGTGEKTTHPLHTRFGRNPPGSRRQKMAEGTWLDSEEKAYPSYDEYYDEESGETDYVNAVLNSERKFRAIFLHKQGGGFDYITGTCGIPDTAFSIPAYTDRGEEGYLSVRSEIESHPGALEFRVYTGK